MSVGPILSNAALFSFALSSVTYLLAFQRSALQELLANVSFLLFVMATVAASGALAATASEAALVDLSGLLLTASVGWLAIGGHLQFKMKPIGAFVAPLATLILLMKAFVAPPATTFPPELAGGDMSLLGKVHVGSAVLGQAFAIIACAVSLVYLWQQNLLKKKLLDQLPAGVPAMDRLSRLLMLALWSGFILITLGLVSGAIFIQVTPVAPELRLGAKVMWAVVVWIWYLATLLARNVLGKPMKRIAQMSLAGFLILALTYFGMGVFRPGAG